MTCEPPILELPSLELKSTDDATGTTDRVTDDTKRADWDVVIPIDGWLEVESRHMIGRLELLVEGGNRREARRWLELGTVTRACAYVVAGTRLRWQGFRDTTISTPVDPITGLVTGSGSPEYRIMGRMFRERPTMAPTSVRVGTGTTQAADAIAIVHNGGVTFYPVGYARRFVVEGPPAWVKVGRVLPSGEYADYRTVPYVNGRAAGELGPGDYVTVYNNRLGAGEAWNGLVRWLPLDSDP